MSPRFLALSNRIYREDGEDWRIKISRFSHAKFNVPIRYLCGNTKIFMWKYGNKPGV